ncbi:MAG: winged helix-turn-helix domain-containing protein [Peptococcaceae bacterium]|nr:winged helix-turn-helix domain-containing protein [Peptococcaceae bacterium]MBQ2035406.1 winged helix-turn-helix domain-containing protein [Peptococcaceae bacterium]MBQ2120151.1 winged helix-turn-helix domain-containing protein [Peptococcaceae bacterium]MBQ2448504.1 winged helix-turn-helix domain-containing protein [Peptococcaceae bacterium]MBQ5858760.1 winged helix-turn-helix domain-containing protein [Peptococcaceae bacterium]
MIYCVEDEASIRELVVYTLHATGYEAQGFADGKAFWTALEQELPELILLDIMLPGEDGLQILKRIRTNSRTADLPVIMVTAKGTEFDKVIGLDSGADDYIAKPFGMMELVSRVKALLRRTQKTSAAATLACGNLVLNHDMHRVLADGKEVVLTYKEFELLEYLLENRGIVLTRDKILDRVWGIAAEVETRTLDVHIRSLRHKLGASGDLIETVRGVGYRIGEDR